MSIDGFRPIVDALIEGDDAKATDYLLMENSEQQILRSLGGDRMPMNYMLKFEEYLDDHDIYLFDGWDSDECHIAYTPKIDKFWCTFYLFCPEGTDLRGASRITNDQEGQNQVKVKRVEGGSIVMFRILKRYLDQVEAKNREKAEELSKEEMEFM